MTIKSLENNNDSFDYITDCECGLTLAKLFEKLCSQLVNVLIKKYTNKENNKLLETNNLKSLLITLLTGKFRILKIEVKF